MFAPLAECGMSHAFAQCEMARQSTTDIMAYVMCQMPLRGKCYRSTRDGNAVAESNSAAIAERLCQIVAD